jgi:hypothetical protein
MFDAGLEMEFELSRAIRGFHEINEAPGLSDQDKSRLKEAYLRNSAMPRGRRASPPDPYPSAIGMPANSAAVHAQGSGLTARDARTPKGNGRTLESAPRAVARQGPAPSPRRRPTP